MDTAEGRLLRHDIAHDERHILAVIHIRKVGMRLEHAILCRQIGHCHLADQLLRTASVLDQIGDSRQLHIEALRHLDQLLDTSHFTIIAHDLTDHAHGLQPGQTHQIDRRFGVAGTLQDAAAPRHQRANMSGTIEVARHRLRVGQLVYGHDPVLRAATRGGTFGGIDRDRKRRLHALAVFAHHQLKMKLAQTLLGHWHGDDAAGLAGHQGNMVCRDKLARDHEIAFVLAVFIIDKNDHLPSAQIPDHLLDGGEGRSGRIVRFFQYSGHGFLNRTLFLFPAASERFGT